MLLKVSCGFARKSKLKANSNLFHRTTNLFLELKCKLYAVLSSHSFSLIRLKNKNNYNDCRIVMDHLYALLSAQGAITHFNN